MCLALVAGNAVLLLPSDIAVLPHRLCSTDNRPEYSPSRRCSSSWNLLIMLGAQQRSPTSTHALLLTGFPPALLLHAGGCRVYRSQRRAQNSGPSGSLLLSREALSSSSPCRFIPAQTHIFLWRRNELHLGPSSHRQLAQMLLSFASYAADGCPGLLRTRSGHAKRAGLQTRVANS